MIPIQELLSRIQHDPDFGSGTFEIGYADRFDPEIHRVPLEETTFPPAEKLTFVFCDASGRTRSIPFHRIREVYRDGRLIWQRP